jgi:hypothetical protein
MSPKTPLANHVKDSTVMTTMPPRKAQVCRSTEVIALLQVGHWKSGGRIEVSIRSITVSHICRIAA